MTVEVASEVEGGDEKRISASAPEGRKSRDDTNSLGATSASDVSVKIFNTCIYMYATCVFVTVCFIAFITLSVRLALGRFHRDIDMCFVPSDRLAAVAQDCGLSPRQIKLHGLPIRPGFSKKPEQVIQVTNSENAEEAAKEALQRKLGLKPGVKACLVVGGGDGVGGLKGIADSVGAKLAEENTESQVRVGYSGERLLPRVFMAVANRESEALELRSGGGIDCTYTSS